MRSILMNMSVCLFVCLLAYLRNHTAELRQFFVHVSFVPSSSDGVAIRNVDDVVFSH